MGKILVLLCVVCCMPLAHASCKVVNVSAKTTSKEWEGIDLLGYAWLKSAKVCDIGAYTIIAPAKPTGATDERIIVLQNDKPVLDRRPGQAMLYNPNSKHGLLGDPAVLLWYGPSDGKGIDRLWYRTPTDKDGKYIQVDDLNFDGQPDVRMIWKGLDISEAYAWYEGRWAKMGQRCIIIDNKCMPAKFKDGQWRIHATGGTAKRAH